MARSGIGIENSKLKLPVALKKNGFSTYRFCFNGFEAGTNLCRKFFIELSQVNPLLSPGAVVFGSAPQMNYKEEDLQYALAGTESVGHILSDKFSLPSYYVVRIGVLGHGAKQLCSYFCAQEVKNSAVPFVFESENCKFSNCTLSGKMMRTDEEVMAHPEFMSSGGTAIWNLSYEIKQSDGKNGVKEKPSKWIAVGRAVEFSGSLNFDGCEYFVEGGKSFGYIDFSCGDKFAKTMVHLSSSHLIKDVTGEYLPECTVAVHGEYDGKTTVFARLEETSVNFLHSEKNKNFINTWTCNILPDPDEDETLHWSLSLSNRKWIADIDVFCATKELLARRLELPNEAGKSIELLTGGSGYGKIRLYKKNSKNIEMIEDFKMENVMCEFGRMEDDAVTE